MTQETPAPDGPRDEAARKREAERTRKAERVGWVERRREKVIAEIERNRRGEYKVPTWVLVVALVAIIAVWAGVIIFA